MEKARLAFNTSLGGGRNKKKAIVNDSFSSICSEKSFCFGTDKEWIF